MRHDDDPRPSKSCMGQLHVAFQRYRASFQTKQHPAKRSVPKPKRARHDCRAATKRTPGSQDAEGQYCAMSANRPGSHRRRGGQRTVTGQYNGRRVVGLRSTGKLRVMAGPQRPSALQPAGRHPFTAVHRYLPTLALLGMEMERALLTGGHHQPQPPLEPALHPRPLALVMVAGRPRAAGTGE